ncbi:uncharacterized protein [Narcine bancroftii]|uniref:uncharacterized protein n=1 Tax=Narcine bancroftii TaxID=1343680 RepID=UPI003831181A
MGGSKSKGSSERSGLFPGVPLDSPLGRMFENWDSKRYRDKDKKKMVQYCLLWSKQPIKGSSVWWPKFGSDEDWVRQALNIYGNSRQKVNQEESAYAFCWVPWPRSLTKCFKLRVAGEKKWEPLDNLPPPYVPPVPTAPEGSSLLEGKGDESDCPARGWERRDELRESDPKLKPVNRPWTRSQTGPGPSKAPVSLNPLKEVPMGGPGGGTGYVNVPLTSTEVRGLKKEMKSLLEDPMGLAEQFDQFLGSNTYTWEEMHAIMGTLFSPQERQMIRQAALLMWEREQPGDPRPHEQKYPLNEPRWDKRTPEGLANLRKRGLLAQTPPLDFSLHKVEPGDWILINTWKTEKLQPQWEGPFQVLLTTEAAVRTREKGWMHASRFKGPVEVPQDPDMDSDWTCVPGDKPLTLRFRRKT